MHLRPHVDFVAMNSSHTPGVPAGQEDVFAFLGDPATHGMTTPVRRIDTHAAAVFLAGGDVYKIKRAVKLPFLDQSTLARRRAACEAEVRVNRAFTPDLYIGTVPITHDGAGLRIGGHGEPVEWAVHMHRFDENRTLDHVAERGEITPGLVAAVAASILASHRSAAIGDGRQATDALAGVVNETLDELTAAAEVFPADETAKLASTMRAAFDAVRPLLMARGAKGRVRRCHGDLHLRNIALRDGAPILFDAIEFDEFIATTDVLYDVAFALMDLVKRGLVGHANLLLNRYLWGTEDMAAEIDGLAALPLFMSLRAAVLAKIDAIRFRDVARDPAIKDEALRYFEVASTLLKPRPPAMVAIGGLSGTGKTTLAAKIAPALGRLPGAVHLRSDIERKRMFGVAENDRLPQDAYDRAVTDKVYASLRTQAMSAIRAGSAAIVDAVHASADERALIAEIAMDAGVRFVGLWLEAPLDVLVERVSARRGDASDATAGVVSAQAEWRFGTITWTRIDSSQPIEAMVAAALAASA